MERLKPDLVILLSVIALSGIVRRERATARAAALRAFSHRAFRNREAVG